MEYRFAGYSLNTARHTLSLSGEAIHVEPRVFDLLHLLAREAGALVSRDRMIEEIWSGRIVSDSAVSACIASVRRAVNDTGKSQTIIRTVPRRGLVMIAEVERVGREASEGAAKSDAAVQRIRYTKNAEGRRLAYAVSGSGPAVFYMRLSGAANLEVEWNQATGRAYFDELTSGFTVLRSDPVGAGQSERGALETDFRRMAADAVAVADAAGIERFSIYSTSGGVLPAVNLAAMFPERVERLAIVGGYVDGRVRRQPSGHGDVIRRLIAEGWDQPEGAFATAVLASYFPEGPFEEVKDLVRLMQSSLDAAHMVSLRDVINDASVGHLLSKIACPTLIVHGRLDGVHPLGEAQKLASEIASSELVILETANHLPLPGSPVWRTFMDTLVEFLSENRR